MSSSCCRIIAVLCVIGITTPALSQEVDISYPEGFDEPMPMYEKALGPFNRMVTTDSEEAQAYMRLGFQMMYAFAHNEAPRAFRAAHELDPNCAMCFWAEAWSWGPYLNSRMQAEDAPRAYAAIQKAQDLAKDHATEVEQALIRAMAVRYEPEHDSDNRARLDTLYAAAMAEVFEVYPEDLDVGTLYAEALMLLEPRRGLWDINKSEVQHIHDILEHVLERDLKHPGACHLYIHATEPTVQPELAEPCAEFMGNTIPGASHINHMPSHTWNRVGRWGDAVRANIQAWHSDLKAEINEGFAIYPSHNLHMLLFAASMDGQGGVATQAAKDYAKLRANGNFYQVLTLLRFGRFDEVLELNDPPQGVVYRGFWDFGRGYAYLKTGNPDKAQIYLERVEEGAKQEGSFRGHPAKWLLGTVGGILKGELMHHQGKTEEAIAALEHAIVLEDSLRYDEPEPLNFSARSWLGAILLETDQPEQAEAVYREALRDHPNNGWELLGLEQALRAQGKDDEADEVHEQFKDAWARADTWIQSSRF